MKEILVRKVGWLSELSVQKIEDSTDTVILLKEGAESGEVIHIRLSEFDTKRLRRKLNWSLSLNPKKKRVTR